MRKEEGGLACHPRIGPTTHGGGDGHGRGDSDGDDGYEDGDGFGDGDNGDGNDFVVRGRGPNLYCTKVDKIRATNVMRVPNMVLANQCSFKIMIVAFVNQLFRRPKSSLRAPKNCWPLGRRENWETYLCFSGPSILLWH